MGLFDVLDNQLIAWLFWLLVVSILLLGVWIVSAASPERRYAKMVPNAFFWLGVLVAVFCIMQSLDGLDDLMMSIGKENSGRKQVDLNVRLLTSFKGFLLIVSLTLVGYFALLFCYRWAYVRPGIHADEGTGWAPTESQRIDPLKGLQTAADVATVTQRLYDLIDALVTVRTLTSQDADKMKSAVASEKSNVVSVCFNEKAAGVKNKSKSDSQD